MKKSKKSSTPMVSVSLICYNQEKYISKAIDSVLMQKTKFDYEIVLSDDCSTDDTAEICKKYAEKYPDIIRLIKRDKNIGGVRNYLENYKLCKGKYISYLEGDDFFVDPYKLQKQVDFLEKNPDYAICCGHVEVVDEYGEFKGQLLPSMKDTYTVNELCKGDFVSTPTCMVRNHLIDTIPEWLFEFNGCDWTFDIVNAEYGKIKFMDEILAAYRIHNHGEWNKLTEKEKIKTVISMVEKVNKYTEYKYDKEFKHYLTALYENRRELYNKNKIFRTVNYIKRNPLFFINPKFYKKFIKKVFLKIYNSVENDMQISNRINSIQYELDCLKVNSIANNYNLDLLIIDDFFPIELSGFRFAEFNYYLDYFKKSKVLTTLSIKPMIKDSRSKYEIITDYYKRNIDKNSSIILYDKDIKINAKVAYIIFLSNTYNFLPFLEKNNIPFVFTLYPGGGFALNNIESDHKLDEIFSSKLFKKVIVTQKATYDYLLKNNFCSKDKIEFINGGIILDNSNSFSLGEKQFFGYDKDVLDICFVAQKYMSDGSDKGYDYFIKFAKRFAKMHDNVRFHVVGGMQPEDINIDEIKDKISFYGVKSFSWFKEFYRDKDIILSPNIPFKLGPGCFDGFPLTCVLDAMCNEVAAFCCDELKSNIFYTDKKDMVFIKHDIDDIIDKIEFYYNNYELLRKLAEEGKNTTKKNYSYEAQLKPRIKVIEESIKGGNE